VNLSYTASEDLVTHGNIEVLPCRRSR
jgi:hypothetical protein